MSSSLKAAIFLVLGAYTLELTVLDKEGNIITTRKEQFLNGHR